jgi:type II restriction enzyme
LYLFDENDQFHWMNLSMTVELAAAYKSGAQRTRVVTEDWGAQNLYCPNCSSPALSRLAHNTKASDFRCPNCKYEFQLKGQKSRLGHSVTDGAYRAMMDAIRSDAAPNYYFMHYDLATWTVRNLLLVPSFAFPPSAIVKRNPLSATARRAGWVGCNFALHRIPADARISVVAESVALPENEVREKFRRVKPLQEISVKERGWTLDVLNIVRRLHGTFTNADVYAFERELEKLHPGNRHIRDKIRQQLQVLRDMGFLVHVEKSVWKLRG